jgi:ribosome-binding protein aMBF1 (putative translation factor)
MFWFLKKDDNKSQETISPKMNREIKEKKKEIGSILKKARESFSMNIEDISEKISIKENDLRDLEDGTLSSGKLNFNDIEKIIENYPLSYNQKKFILTEVDDIMVSVGSNHTDEKINLKEIVQDLEK